MSNEKSCLGKVLIVTSTASMLDQFNIPNIKLLQSMGYAVSVAANFVLGNTCTDEKIKALLKMFDKMNVDSYQIDFNRKSTDIRSNIKAFYQLDQVIRGKRIPIHGVKCYHEEKMYSFLHCQSPIGGVIGRIVAKKNKIKVIYTAHGFHFYTGAPKKNWIIYYPIEKIFSWITDILITINKEDFERAEKFFYAKNTYYIPGIGVDIEKISHISIQSIEKKKDLEIKETDIVFLSVGELIPRKNHEIVIRALANIQNQNIKYFICGQGKLESYLKNLVQTLGMSEQVKFLGFRTDVLELYRLADLFIFPSLQEGLSVALMEAIASRIPVVCSNIRGNIDLICDNEFLFDPNNEGSVIGCIRKMTEGGKENLKKNFGKIVEKNYEMLKSYDITKVDKIMKEIYEMAINIEKVRM